ncbi:hypothetical protein PT2222_240062 [Paraburkholderia tropica]
MIEPSWKRARSPDPAHENGSFGTENPAAPPLTKKRVAPAQDVCSAVAYTATDTRSIEPISIRFVP